MGLFDRFKRSPSSDIEAATRKTDERHYYAGPKLKLTVSLEHSPLMQLAGTTTNSKDAANTLAQRHDLADGVALHVVGSLQREPDNGYDPSAVAVLVEGERIGYLPSYAAKDLQLSVGSSVTVPLQLFCAHVGSRLRVEAFVWMGDGEPEWKYSTENPPAMTPEQKRMAAHEASSTMVRDALSQGGTRAEQFASGLVQGVHYLEMVEPIKELKREGKLEEALTLCYAAMEGAEKSRDGREPAPWYTEQAAIIHRKLGQKDQEIAVLERWLTFVPADVRSQTGLGERLAKLTR